MGDLQVRSIGTSVVDPDPVFGPPGSFDTGIQAKIVRKTLITTVLWLIYDLSLTNDVNVASKSNKLKDKENFF